MLKKIGGCFLWYVGISLIFSIIWVGTYSSRNQEEEEYEIYFTVEEKQEALARIEILDFKIVDHPYKDILIARFGLKNNSNKLLKRVEVTVYFYDSEDKPIHEETYVPISDDSMLFSRKDPALKPNYVWREKLNEFEIRNLGPEWSGKAKAFVTHGFFSEKVFEIPENQIDAEVATEVKIEDEAEVHGGKSAEFEFEKKYFKNIEILDFSATKIDTYSQKDIPAIRFGLKNNGDKTVDQIEVTVFFLDDDDHAIYEKVITKYEVLKPNYIWRQEPDRYYTIENLGPEWSGKANAVITGVRFSD